jgi:uncharacterized metal-binding protein YceD (DUF177 family)
MKENLKKYDISFVGLKEGIHEYNYKIGKEFFTNYINADSVLEDGNVDVELQLEKSSTMLVLMFSIKGILNVECDVCLDPLALNISDDFRQICKFSDEGFTSSDDEITAIPTSDYEINVARFIYEFIHLCVPAKMTHEEGGCNDKIKDIVSQYLLTEQPNMDSESKSEENDIVDPRWAALKELKDKN